VFAAVDKNKDGKIDVNELQEAMTYNILGLPPFPASTLMKAFDVDGDDIINEQEFVLLMKCTSFMNDQQKEQDQQMPTTTASGNDDDIIAKQLAERNCRPLLSCPPEQRSEIKKNILLQWHPDKQRSKSECDINFATKVMQEMQKRPEWNSA